MTDERPPQERSPRVRAAALVATSRVLLFAVGLAAVLLFGHAPNTGPPPPTELAYLPARWDASWYMGIAGAGYRWEPGARRNSRIAFFPAYPLALGTAGRALRLPNAEVPWLWTGVVLSCAFFAGALVYLYRLTTIVAGVRAGEAAMLVAIAYPWSLFHGQVYSESLFLLAALGATYAVARGRPVRGFLWGVVCGLCRPTAILLAFALVSVAGYARDRHRPSGWRSWLSLGVVMSGPAVGTALYSAYLRWLTGDALAWLHAQEGWGRPVRGLAGSVGDVVSRVAALGPVGYAMERPYELINVVALLFGLALVVPVARRFGFGLGLFVFLGILAPLVVGGLASMGRYTCVLFPVFMWIAAASQRRLPWWIATFALVQVVLAALFFTDRPVY